MLKRWLMAAGVTAALATGVWAATSKGTPKTDPVPTAQTCPMTSQNCPLMDDQDHMTDSGTMPCAVSAEGPRTCPMGGMAESMMGHMSGSMMGEHGAAADATGRQGRHRRGGMHGGMHGRMTH